MVIFEINHVINISLYILTFVEIFQNILDVTFKKILELRFSNHILCLLCCEICYHSEFKVTNLSY
jgi:hypothetical protein